MPDTIAAVSPEPAATIEIRLSRPQQLFNSLDPSPFHERDLDQDAEEYLIDSADEYPLKKPLTLIIHLPADQIPASGTPDLAQAIHNYFAYRVDMTERRLRRYFRDGRISLAAGLVFLFVCIALRHSRSPWGEAWRRRSPTRACTLSAGWPCGGPWRSSSTTGGRSGTARDSTPSWLGSLSLCARPEAVLRSRT